MRRMVGLAIVVGVAATLLMVPAHSSWASWVSSHCNTNQIADDHVRRLDAQAYAAIAENEGYEWGGGCWNNDNVDDTPGQPDSNGEGPDCSGFTFKTWELKSNGYAGFTWHDKFQDIHGQYSSYDFHAPGSDDPFFKLPDKNRQTTDYMDAFAKAGHVGMLYTSAYPSSGSDYIIEALGDAPGVDVNVETYRFNSDYVGVRREGWTVDCYPNCPPVSASSVRIP